MMSDKTISAIEVVDDIHMFSEIFTRFIIMEKYKLHLDEEYFQEI